MSTSLRLLGRAGGVALAALLTSCLGCRHEESVDAAVDDAAVDDAADDAAVGPPEAPLLVWTRGVAEPCANLLTPQFREAVPAAMPGHRRWTAGLPYLGQVPPSYAGTASYWADRDFYFRLSLDLDTGERVDDAFYAPGPAPTGEGDMDQYWRYLGPLMTLGSSILVSRDAFSLLWYDVSGPGVRRGGWTFPEVEERVDRARPLPARNRQLEHVMPAWSPTHGTIAYTVGYLNMMVAAQCAEEDGGRFILAFAAPPPAGYRGTHVFYRENGELLVHRGGLYVIGPTGDLLRSRGLAVDATPLGYAAGCGMLYRAADGSVSWLDVDTMEWAPRLRVPPSVGARPLTDCGVLVGARDFEITRYTPSRDAVRLADANTSVAPLADGRFALYLPDSREVSIVDGAGIEVLRFALEGPPPPPERVGGPFWTPDGDIMVGDGLFELGMAPAPDLLIGWGLNWAHTNSPLPR